jgi:hypothetical protein
MANKSGGASKTGQAASYKALKRWETNRKKRLMKLAVEQPNNTQIPAALSGMVYRRKTPTTPFWSSTRIKVAGLFKRYTGKVNMDIFSNNEKVAGPALMVPGPYSKQRYPSVNEKIMFSIGQRAHFGDQQWNS